MKFNWNIEQQTAFKTLQNKLISRPLLAIYDPDLDTEIHTDASKVGLAAILMQKGKSGKLQPISFYSRQTNKCEEKYHSYELEVLAVVEALKRYRVYLLGKKFKVVSDCSAIRTCASKKDILPRIARWWLLLQEFDFEIVHRPGTKMAHVDALSRNPVTDKQEELLNNFIFHIQNENWALAGQLSDVKLNHIHSILQKPSVTDQYESKIHKEYKLKDDKIYKIINNKEVWVVPRNMRREIVSICHDNNGHFSLDKTLSKLQESYWFENMRNYVMRYIAACIPCLYNKKPKGKVEGFMHPIDKIPIPFHTIHIDHVGPLTRSTGGKKHILVLIDAFTKFIFLCPTRNTSTAPVIKFLTSIFSTYGTPTRLISDRGTAFTSRSFQNFCKNLNIKHIQIAVGTPRANGELERYNATTLDALRTTINKEKEWEKRLPEIQFALNNSVNATTGKTPSELLMGYRPRNPAEAIINVEIQPNRPIVNSLKELREEVYQQIKRKQNNQKKRFDKKRKIARKYEVDDLVLVQKQHTTEGSKKLLPVFKGPFKIIKVLENDRYVIRDIEGSKRSQRILTSVEAVDKLRPWLPQEGISSSSEDEL